MDVLPTRGLTAKQAERMTRINDSDLPRVSTQPRDKQESREERKARKQAIKEERKVRRSKLVGQNLNVSEAIDREFEWKTRLSDLFVFTPQCHVLNDRTVWNQFIYLKM